MTIAVVQQMTGRKTIRRCPGWDYASPGAYFVTVCTQHHRCYVGEVLDGKTVFNPLGVIAELCWQEFTAHHKNVILDVFFIMLNHVHGIIVITDCDNANIDSVAALPATPLQIKDSESASFSAKSAKKGSLLTNVRSCIPAVTKFIHRDLNPSFAWHGLFYDHIIRDERDLETFRLYSTVNSENWRINEHDLMEVSVHV